MSCNCSSCHSPVVGSSCGCGSSACHPFEVSVCSTSCPPPPSIEPCGYRTLEDGTKIPVWHSAHPLIPRLMECFGQGVNSCGECTIEELACELKATEQFYSTCAYPGDKYYLAIIYHVLAKRELKELYGRYQSAQMAGVANGKGFDPVELTIGHTYWGQLLAGLKGCSPSIARVVAI